MKRLLTKILVIAMGFVLCGCNGTVEQVPLQTPEVLTWQEQYDLGIRYLSEGNYEEAVLAFTAAIEIDPKRSEAYVGLADSYIGMGDPDQAKEILQAGLDVVEDSERINEYLDEHFGVLRELDGYPKMVRGEIDNGYTLTEYDKYGQIISKEWYNKDDKLTSENHYSYDEAGKIITHTSQNYKHDNVYHEDHFDDQQRITSRSTVWKSDNGEVDRQDEHSYKYPDENTVLIQIQLLDGEKELTTSKNYTLQEPGNYVIAAGFHWSVTDRNMRITHIVEYSSPPPHSKTARDVRYDRDGNESEK